MSGAIPGVRSHTYAQQQQFTITADLIRNAFDLCLKAGVGPIVLANVLIDRAALIVAVMPPPARALAIAALEQNFKDVVAGHVAKGATR